MTSEEEVTVPGKRVSMRKTREVLRLYFDLKLGQRQIARSASVSQSTVHDYLERFTAAGLSWPLPTVEATGNATTSSLRQIRLVLDASGQW